LATQLNTRCVKTNVIEFTSRVEPKGWRWIVKWAGGARWKRRLVGLKGRCSETAETRSPSREVYGVPSIISAVTEVQQSSEIQGLGVFRDGSLILSTPKGTIHAEPGDLGFLYYKFYTAGNRKYRER
jgi:hypothetical protein